MILQFLELQLHTANVHAPMETSVSCSSRRVTLGQNKQIWHACQSIATALASAFVNVGQLPADLQDCKYCTDLLLESLLLLSCPRLELLLLRHQSCLRCLYLYHRC